LTSVRHIKQLSRGEGGGKADGLALLSEYGARIPETFVITQYDEADILSFLDEITPGKSFAVRSSADGEDGTLLSFAGQFQSFLNLKTKDEVLQAVRSCFASISEERIATYAKEHRADVPTAMNVIVQHMINARCSGALFTVDPVSQRHDQIRISIAEGLGEDLMSGHTAGEELLLMKHSPEFSVSTELTESQLRELVNKSIEIEKHYGRPADLEWAVDEEGVLWWLQLRPITNLNEEHFNELDDHALFDNPVYTRANIGEMMPGPVTPLTMSTFGRAIEVGLQVFYNKIGAIREMSEKNIFVHSYYNHLFFDLHSLYQSTRNVLMSKKENVDMAVVGEIVPGIEVKLETGFLTGLRNLFSMIGYINSAPKAWRKLRDLHGSFELSCSGDEDSCYGVIDEKLHILHDAYSLHYVTSSQSGSLYTTILNIHTGGKIPERHHQEKVARLFNNIPDVVGAAMLSSLDKLTQTLSKQEDILERFVDAPDQQAIAYLTVSGPREVIGLWNKFIEDHGQRCVREAELYEEEWSLNPLPVVEGLRTRTGLMVKGFNGHTNGYAGMKPSLIGNGLNPVKRVIVRMLLPKARKAVARREQTKAWSIGIQYKFKKAYRVLAKMLTEKGKLMDESNIFFLTHQEIGEMLSSENYTYWDEKANARKKIYPELQQLSFPDLNFGIPVPEEVNSTVVSGELTGIPVSRGIAEGRVRLVNSMTEARLLQKDEIMVARFTDIGWTPFYGVVAGLVTEIGSPLSHGAVVAREYGLPAVVSMKGAMSALSDGQLIKLDAIKGKVTVLD
jgi:pyruvate,water dikinase